MLYFCLLIDFCLGLCAVYMAFMIFYLSVCGDCFLYFWGIVRAYYCIFMIF